MASSAWLGLSVAMTTLALLAATADPGIAATAYQLMGLVGTRAVAAAAIAIGLLLSAATPWGRIRAGYR